MEHRPPGSRAPLCRPVRGGAVGRPGRSQVGPYWWPLPVNAGWPSGLDTGALDNLRLPNERPFISQRGRERRALSQASSEGPAMPQPHAGRASRGALEGRGRGLLADAALSRCPCRAKSSRMSAMGMQCTKSARAKAHDPARFTKRGAGLKALLPGTSPNKIRGEDGAARED